MLRVWRAAELSARAAGCRRPRGRVRGTHRADLPLHRLHKRFGIVHSARLDDETRLTRATNVREGISAHNYKIRPLPYLDRPEPIAESDRACAVDRRDAKHGRVRNTRT